MIWLYALAAFTGIGLMAYASVGLWRHCKVRDPDEKQAMALRCYAASRREI